MHFQFIDVDLRPMNGDIPELTKKKGSDNVQIQTFRGPKRAQNQDIKISHNFRIFMKQIQFSKP